MAAQPFTVSITLQLSSDEQAAAPVQFDFSSAADSLVTYRLKLVGSGSKLLDFGTLPAAGAKLMLIAVDAVQGVASVVVTVNGNSAGEEITAGGAKLFVSPSPVFGVTSVTLVWSADTSVRVWVLG